MARITQIRRSTDHERTALLNRFVDNVRAARLGEIALTVGDPKRGDAGDNIDRGLILLRLLSESGFGIVELEGSDAT